MNFRHTKLITGLFLAAVISITLGTPTASAQQKDDELFLVAQKSFEDGFYDVALRYIDQLLTEYPQTEKRSLANLIKGQCYFFQNQYLKAYEIFEDNLKNPEHQDATLYWLGETYLKGSDYTEAKAAYEKVLKLYPDSEYVPQSLYSMGWLNFEQEKYTAARKYFANLIQNYPDHKLTEDAEFKVGEALFNDKKYEEAIKVLTKHIFSYPKSIRQAESHFYIAECNYYLENYLEAVSYYAKTAEFAYDQNLVLMSKVSLGWSYLKLERYELAREHFEDALEFSKERKILSDDVYLGLARLYSQAGEHEKAINAYSKLITNFPDSVRVTDSYLGMANTYYQLNRFKDAVETYTSLIDRFGNDPAYSGIIEKAYFGLAWSYLKSGDIDKAVSTFSIVKNKAKNETVKISAMTQIGDAYQDAEKYEKAIAIYDQILSAYQDSAYIDYVQYRQGIALLKMGLLDAATMSFQTLENNFPGSKYNQDKNYYLAVAYFKKGNWIMAKHQVLDFIERAADSNPLLPEAHYILVLSQYQLNNYDDAIKRAKSLIKEFPDNKLITQNTELTIAKAYYQQDKVHEALKNFHILTEQYPKTEIAEEALVWMGDHHLKSGAYDAAIEIFNTFIEQFPGSSQVNIIRYQLGQAHEAKQDYEAAVAAYKDIDEKVDRVLSAKARLAIANIFSRNLDPESAIATYENITVTSPEFKRDAYIRIAEVHKGNRNFSEANTAYKTALKAEQSASEIGNAELHFLIADSYELLNERDKAIEEYFKVPYLFPKQLGWVTKAYLRLARIFEDNERWAEATTVYKKIVELGREESVFAEERLDWIKENIESINN